MSADIKGEFIAIMQDMFHGKSAAVHGLDRHHDLVQSNAGLIRIHDRFIRSKFVTVVIK